jgi:hypothetical protein
MITPEQFNVAMEEVHYLDGKPYVATVVSLRGVDMIEVRNINDCFYMYFDTCENFLQWAANL